jgi:hypothetical protein
LQNGLFEKTGKDANMRTIYLITTLLLALLAISFPLAWLAYSVGPLSLFSLYEGLASFLFWFAIVALTLLFPLRYVASLFAGYIKTLRGLGIFVSYMSLHLILYGVILEGIVAYSFKSPSVVSQAYFLFESIPFIPVSAFSILSGFAFNPTVELFIPPVYVLALSFYVISLSFLIGALVLTNVLKVVEIGKTCGTAFRSRSLILMPALGVIGGAACCLSLPVLLSLVAPTTAIISDNPSIFYIAYFVFPIATAIGLKFNMDSTSRIASKVSKVVFSRTAPGSETPGPR